MLALNGPYFPRVIDAGHLDGRDCEADGGVQSDGGGLVISDMQHVRSAAVYSLLVFDAQRIGIEYAAGTVDCSGFAAVLLPPGQTVRLHCDDLGQMWYVQFLVAHDPDWVRGADADTTGVTLKRQPDPMHVWGLELPVVLNNHIRPEVHKRVRRITALWELQHDRELVEANLVLQALLADIVLQQLQTPQRRLQHQLTRIRRRAERQIGDGLTVKCLAHWAQMDRALFTRRFQDYFGFSPGVYLRYLRLAYAVRLLVLSPDMDVADIAQQLGYADHAGFTRAFRAGFACSPVQLRADMPGRHPLRLVRDRCRQLRLHLGLPSTMAPLLPRDLSAVRSGAQSTDGHAVA